MLALAQFGHKRAEVRKGNRGFPDNRLSCIENNLATAALLEKSTPPSRKCALKDVVGKSCFEGRAVLRLP
jgi:hypothetical protein